ncbi:MAG: HNH endonuclease family protein [Gammaproteobacteria bacterium]
MNCFPHPSASIGSLWVRQKGINLEPEYQREAAVWGIEKRQLFIDSLLNRYDVPKIYMHRLPKGELHEYALVDGKQRLGAIWGFMEGEFSLADEFVMSPPRHSKTDEPLPKAKDKFRDFPQSWQEDFKAISLPVIIIDDADEGAIEEIFSRLNDGEPLNAAEKRNAIGGKMCRLIKKVAEHKFLSEYVSFNKKRYMDYDIAARFLLIEDGIAEGQSPYRDLKKKFLDKLVKDYKVLSPNREKQLWDMTNKQLNELVKVFGKKDRLLRKQGDSQLHYLFVKHMTKEYAGRNLFSQIRAFLPEFHTERAEALRLGLEQKTGLHHSLWGEFERLTRQGNDKKSLMERVSTMCKFFLEKYPDTKIRDKKRSFSDAEKHAIFILGGKKCADCGIKLDYDNFQADHFVQWAHGGETTLKNARALCKECNAKRNAKVK